MLNPQWHAEHKQQHTKNVVAMATKGSHGNRRSLDNEITVAARQPCNDGNQEEQSQLFTT